MRFKCGYKGIFSRFSCVLLSVLIAAVMFAVSACDNGTGDPQQTPTPEPTPSASATPSPETALIKNGSFEEFYDTSFPKTPKNWTSYGESFAGVSAPMKNSKYGIVNTEDESFTENKEKYGDVDNPGIWTNEEDYDTNVIMIYNEQPTAVKYKSTSINLPKNSYAHISLYVSTIGISPIEENGYSNYGATINISGMEEPVYINGIDTVGEWKQYHIYIEGSPSTSKTLYLELGLGSGSPANSIGYTSGHAFFDDVKMEFINKADYEDILIAENVVDTDPGDNSPIYQSNDDYFFYYDGNKDDINPYLANRIDIRNDNQNIFAYSYKNRPNIITEISFEEAFNDGDITAAQTESNDYLNNIDAGFEKDSGLVAVGGTEFEEELTKYPFTSSKVFMMENKTFATQGFKTADITLLPYTSPVYENDIQPSYSHYRIGVYVKTSDFIGKGLNIGLFNDGKEDIQPVWINDINTTQYNLSEDELEESANLHNKWSGWTEYIFYVEANPFYEVNLHLEFWLGPKFVANKQLSEFTRGYALFSELSVEMVTQSEYSSATESDTVKAGITMYTSKTPGIANSGFNAFSDRGINKRPVLPNNWSGYFGGNNKLPGNEESTIVDNYNSVYGVINKYHIEDYDFDNVNLLDKDDIDDPIGYPNVLMINNVQPTSYGFTSQSRSISKEVYRKISVWVRTYGGAEAYIYITDDDGVIVDKDDTPLEYTDITVTEWTEYIFYIHTGELSKNFKLEVWNGSRDGSVKSQGIVLFDDAVLAELTEASFEAADGSKPNVMIADYEGFDIAPEESPTPTPEPTPSHEPEEEEVPYVFPWGLFTTSIIAFVLVFVLIILAFRKLKQSKAFKPKKVKTKKPSYSRDAYKTKKKEGVKQIKKDDAVKDKDDDDDDDDDIEYYKDE